MVALPAVASTWSTVLHGDQVTGFVPPAWEQAGLPTESGPLGTLRTVTLTPVVADPEKLRAGAGGVSETGLAVGWGAVRR